MRVIWGNTARKPPKIPLYEFHVDKKSGDLILRPERPPFWGELPYAMVLVATVLFALISCCQYIQIRTNVEYRIRQTEELERQYIRFQNENILAEKILFQIPNLNEVYEIATKELGMVQAQADNVIVYDRTNSEFVYQTDNIPNIDLH